MKIPVPVLRLLNPVMAALLRSTFHRYVSGNILLITFTGRRSGKRYTTPVSYVREGDRVRCFTDSPWWKNLRGGAEVSLRIAGEDRRGRAEAISGDVKRTADALRGFLAAVPRDAVYYDLELDADGNVAEDDLERAAGQVILIEIQLT